MTLSCKITEDLLPLYADRVCSDQTRQAVEAHLRGCPRCRQLLAQAGAFSLPDSPVPQADTDRATARSFRKLRLRWLGSLVLLVLLLPTVILGWNQFRGQGIHFTNLHELAVGSAFLSQLEKGNYEKAYSYIDIDRLRADWLAEWFNEETLRSIRQDGLAQFCKAAQALDAAGGLSDSQYVGIIKCAGYYELIYTVTLDGQPRDLSLHVSDSGVRSISCDGSFLDDPLAQFSLWREWLWEQYAGCYYDPETKQYIYYDTAPAP